MVSTRSFGGIDVTIGKGGLRFKKRKSAFNAQIGKCMEESGVTPASEIEGAGGRYSHEFQKQFITCVAAAQTKDKKSPKVSAAKLKAWDIGAAEITAAKALIDKKKK